MNETLTLAAAGVAGLLLGGLFFGGLWWTVRRGLTSRRPALWFLGSLVLRMGMVLAGFYWIARDQWQPLIPCLLGFVAARLIVIRLTRHASCGKTQTLEVEASVGLFTDDRPAKASTSPNSLERGAP
jgi:F1F0 ATPase subunit 2